MPEPEARVLIVDVHANPSGRDTDPYAERFTIRNLGRQPVDISGWTLRDRAGVVITIPPGYVVRPSQSMTVHTGNGPNTRRRAHAGRGRAVLNNEGDELLLSDSAGRLRQRFRYAHHR